MAAADATSTARRTFRIAVMLETAQLSDIVGIDMFGNLSQQYIALLAPMGPSWSGLLPSALDLKIFYLASSLTPTQITPDLKFMPTTTYDDCPRDLDLVLVGGVSPQFRPEPATRFMREAWRSTKVWMTTCIGSLWLADAVDLAAKKVTTNRGFLVAAKAMHPEIEWADRRWVVEEKPFGEDEKGGELWTAGGAGAGLDMIAQFCLKNFDNHLVNNASLYALELQPGRSQDEVYNFELADLEQSLLKE